MVASFIVGRRIRVSLSAPGQQTDCIMWLLFKMKCPHAVGSVSGRPQERNPSWTHDFGQSHIFPLLARLLQGHLLAGGLVEGIFA